jgi:hypothetical protein
MYYKFALANSIHNDIHALYLGTVSSTMEPCTQRYICKFTKNELNAQRNTCKSYSDTVNFYSATLLKADLFYNFCSVVCLLYWHESEKVCFTKIIQYRLNKKEIDKVVASFQQTLSTNVITNYIDIYSNKSTAHSCR